MQVGRFNPNLGKKKPASRRLFSFSIQDIVQIRPACRCFFIEVNCRSKVHHVNPEIVIRFELAQAEWVASRIYSLDGKLVKQLADKVFPPGIRSVRWNGRDDASSMAASGTYFYRAVGKHIHQIRNMSFVRRFSYRNQSTHRSSCNSGIVDSLTLVARLAGKADDEA